jgi:hypothetical protein
MAYEKLARLMLLPAMFLGQNSQLSDAAQKLVNKPRLGSAQLTWADGRTEQGRIVRVTDQFIAFWRNTRPATCENVELSKVAAVQWLRTTGERGAGSHAAERAAEVAYVGAILAPFYVGNAVANPFKRISPPLNPPYGSWESSGPSPGGLKSSLVFMGYDVLYRTTAGKRGRWSVDQNQLRLMFDGEPASVTPFHFDCGELILDDPTRKFRESSNRKRATSPIVGDWHGSSHHLDLKPDGSVTEEKSEVRKGSFENSGTSVKMHWHDSTGPGGAEWIAQIKHRHIVVNVGGVLMEYHYVPPGLELDL